MLATCFLWFALVAPVVAGGEDGPGDSQESRALSRLDIDRIGELHRISELFGDELWPGFDTREIPIAVNCDDRQELLVGHPRPPKEYRPFDEHELSGSPVLIRDGVDRFGPRGGGWAVDLGGERSGYVSVLQEGQETESYLSLLIHECFHVYQDRIRERADGRSETSPEDDAVYAAMIGLESRILHAAVLEEDLEKARELGRMFVAVRQERRSGLSAEVIRGEGEAEYNEGTATYIQARMFQLIAEAGGIESSCLAEDPCYGGFADIEKMRAEFLRRILPYDGAPISFFHAMYNNGMAQGLVLDRFHPGWKQRITEKGRTQFELTQESLPVADSEQGELVSVARKRFDYVALLESQQRLVDERLATIRGFLEAEGRRYRIYHGRIRKGFNWKPEGPVYDVPRSILLDLAGRELAPGEPMTEERQRLTIWAGGIPRFEKDDFLFESIAVPIIFGQDYLEWIDPDPAPDFSDLKVTSERQEESIHVGLVVTTDGFTVTTGRGRVEKTDGLVKIIPVPE